MPILKTDYDYSQTRRILYACGIRSACRHRNDMVRAWGEFSLQRKAGPPDIRKFNVKFPKEKRFFLPFQKAVKLPPKSICARK